MSLSRADFAALRVQKTKRVHGSLFSLEYAELPRLSSPKVGIVVSKKISPRASARNAIERKAREAARILLVAKKKPIALVLYAKREAAGADFSRVREDIETLLSRAL